MSNRKQDLRTFKEYYDLAKDHHEQWLSMQDEEWWRKPTQFEYDKLSLKGDYIETVKFLSEYEKNDSSLFHNHTNVKNSEWGILFDMLGQALVDWCIENVDYGHLWSFGFDIERVVDGLDNFYCGKYYVKKEVGGQVVSIEDESELEVFNGCCNFLTELVDWFMEKMGNDVPNDWNVFGFGLDALYDSCRFGEWVCSSDGYMNLGNRNLENDEEKYEEYVECM